MRKGSKKLTGMEVIDLAHYWLKEADGDANWAIHLVRTYERGYSRQSMIIEGIKLRMKQAEVTAERAG